jgi:hypothetical protein
MIYHKRMPTEKTKVERLKEGVTLLKKLRETGINAEDIGSKNIQKAVSEWVNTGEEFTGIIPFARYDRNAHINLPKYVGKNASVVLKVIDPTIYEE